MEIINWKKIKWWRWVDREIQSNEILKFEKKSNKKEEFKFDREFLNFFFIDGESDGENSFQLNLKIEMKIWKLKIITMKMEN